MAPAEYAGKKIDEPSLQYHVSMGRENRTGVAGLGFSIGLLLGTAIWIGRQSFPASISSSA